MINDMVNRYPFGSQLLGHHHEREGSREGEREREKERERESEERERETLTKYRTAGLSDLEKGSHTRKLTSKNSARCVRVPILTSSTSLVQYSSNMGRISRQVISHPNTRASSCRENANTRRIFHCTGNTHT
jgi:hypothetical protein